MIFGFENKAAINPNKIAAEIPAAVAFIPPVNMPIKPFSSIASIVPFAKEYPKPVRGTVAPAPANSTIFGYIP